MPLALATPAVAHDQQTDLGRWETKSLTKTCEAGYYNQILTDLWNWGSDGGDIIISPASWLIPDMPQSVTVTGTNWSLSSGGDMWMDAACGHISPVPLQFTKGRALSNVPHHLTLGSKHDLLDAGDADDSIHGGKGHDTIRGNGGNDVLVGGPGRDVLHGDGGIDLLHGGAGRDLLYGGPGKDKALGKGGPDRIHVRDGKSGDVADCGPGEDWVYADKGDKLKGCEHKVSPKAGIAQTLK